MQTLDDNARKPGSGLTDPQGRQFEYLRLSLTDICNYSCTYCLPNGYQKPMHSPRFLTRDEFVRVVRGFAALGVWKLRLTGGEPTIHPEFLEIARNLATIEGIRRLALTTNGYKLDERAQSYRDAGIDAINISIDSLDDTRFAAVTGHDRLAEILRGIDACEKAGFAAIKINAVLMKGVNDQELSAFIAFAKDRDISLRFIEVMRTNDNSAFFEKHHIPAAHIATRLEDMGWSRLAREHGAGPAVEYSHAEVKGRIGLIAPYSKDFCTTCNRLRVSARGKLHLCLFGEGGYDVRPLLQSDDQRAELCAEITRLLGFKKASHFLHEGNSGTRQHLASIGG